MLIQRIKFNLINDDSFHDFVYVIFPQELRPFGDPKTYLCSGGTSATTKCGDDQGIHDEPRKHEAGGVVGQGSEYHICLRISRYPNFRQRPTF